MISLKYIYNRVKMAATAAGASLLLACCLVSCSSDEMEGTAEKSADGKLTFKIFDENSTGSRAATDGQTMVTTFELSDKAGLYVVKGGQVVVENMPLTYNINGYWEAKEPLAASAEYDGAQFYAYYPYSEEATFTAGDANPFAAMIQQTTVPANQTSKADYEAADIMTSTAAKVGALSTVEIALHHNKAMVCVELPNSSYIFNNPGMEPYVCAKAENAKFTLDGTTVQPYFDEATQSYRLIMEPGQPSQLHVTFSNNGEERSYTADNLNGVAMGQYAKFVVDGGATLVNMTLQPGDYYCADGRIVSKDTPVSDLPKNIVGVIFKIGTTDAIRSANANWSHGVVMGLKEVRGKWGNNGSTTTEQNNAGWRYWYRDYGLSDQNGVTAPASLHEDLMAEEGFEVTKAWREVPEPLTLGGITCDFTSLMNQVMDTWMTDNPLPENLCSGWYIPSLGDWGKLEPQLDMLDTQLTKAGGANIRWNTGGSDNYWSCNVRGGGSNWCYVGKKTTLADRYKGVACNGNAYYRMLFAF